MKDISIVVSVICVTSIAFSFVNVLAPEGNTKKILQTILGVFFLCCLIIPVKNFVTDFNFAINVTLPEESIINSAKDAYNQGILVETKSNLETSLLYEYSKNNIVPKDLEIELGVYEDGGVYIKNICVEILKNQEYLSSKIINLTENEFEIIPEIVLR